MADRGPGISDPAKEQLFRKFGAVASDRSNARRSHGLGLYLVRLVAAAHDGMSRIAQEVAPYSRCGSLSKPSKRRDTPA